MTDLIHVAAKPIEIDRAAILRELKLDPASPKTQALLLICDRYNLDPVMKHVVLIEGSPYVTRDGYLTIAHNSGQFDGMEVLSTGQDDGCWWARVSVFRKDMSRPFTYVGRYPLGSANKKYGPEMAIKTAEVAALRRAFNVTGIPAADEQWEAVDAVATPALPPADRIPRITAEECEALKARLNALTGKVRHDFKRAFGVPADLPRAEWTTANAWVKAAEGDGETDPPPDDGGKASLPMGEDGPVGPSPATAEQSTSPVAAPSSRKTPKSAGEAWHRRAGGAGLTPDQHVDLILNVSDGKHTHYTDLSPAEQGAADDLLRNVVDGLYDMDRITEAVRAYQDELLAAQLEASVKAS